MQIGSNEVKLFSYKLYAVFIDYLGELMKISCFHKFSQAVGYVSR